ncbi:MAG: methionyl-tRNA formyltransferase [Candidatus Saccharimonas sp.]
MPSGTNQPIVFFGTEDFSLYSLRSLVEHGFNIVGVVTKPDSKRGRSNQLIEPAVKTYAVSKGIKVWQPSKLSDVTDDIDQLDRPSGVLVSFGKIIPERIINLFSPGIINVHPSLLPRYRGPSPIESAILNRDSSTGVTIMQLVKDMDAGPIYAQSTYQLDQTETKPQLYERLGQLGADLLIKYLPLILSGEITPMPQDNARSSYCHLLAKSQSLLDTKNCTSDELEAQVRAYLGFPKSRLSVGELEIIVTKSHTKKSGETPLDIICADNRYLSVDELIAPSGKTMTRDQFLRGYKI